MRNSFGNAVTVTLFGESHKEAVGCVIDGIAPGIAVDEEYIAREMGRRKAGGDLSTARTEPDSVRFLSGVHNGFTEGTPVTVLIENTNVRPSDYAELVNQPRPGHADYTGKIKYLGYEDPRGGGHFSGRLTAPLCAAGALLSSALEKKGIHIGSHILQIGTVTDRSYDECAPEILLRNEGKIPVLDADVREKMEEEIRKAKKEGDSVGGIIETAVTGLPAGIGEPWFDSIESELAHILFAVPACKGIEFGAGFGFAGRKGSEANDCFEMRDGKVITRTNHNGGINGGISNGMPVLFRTVFKPTPSVAKAQMTLNMDSGKTEELVIHGRHDPCVVLRAVPVVDACTAIALADLLTQRYGNLWLGGAL